MGGMFSNWGLASGIAKHLSQPLANPQFEILNLPAPQLIRASNDPKNPVGRGLAPAVSHTLKSRRGLTFFDIAAQKNLGKSVFFY